MKTIMERPGHVTFGQALADYWHGYVDFLGRTTRAGYWWQELIIGGFWCLFLAALIVRVADDWRNHFVGASFGPYLGFLVIGFVAFLVTMLPSLAVEARRYRDAGLSGYGILVLMVMQYGLTFSVTINATATTSNVKDQVWKWTQPSLGDTLSSLIALFLLVVSFLPTDAMVTSSDNRILRFFLRARQPKK